MKEDMQPLDADLAELLDAERSAAPPAGSLDRVWGRLAAVSPMEPGIPRKRGPLGLHPLPLTVAAFVLGGAVGAGLVLRLRPPIEHLVRVAVPAPVAVPFSAPPAALAEPSPAEQLSIPQVALRPKGPHAAAPSSLAAEQLLLDEARAALTARDPERALKVLSEHARRFAHPRLGEEREALAIQALALLGRYDEARARAARFRASTPDSLFLPAVDATLGSIP